MYVFYLRFTQSIEYDLWQSLDAGRPLIFNQAYVDCKYPQNPTEHDTVKQQLREFFLVVRSTFKLTVDLPCR